MNVRRNVKSKRIPGWVSCLLVASLLLAPNSAALAQTDEPASPPAAAAPESEDAVEQAGGLDAVVPTGIAPLAPHSEDAGYLTGHLWPRSQEQGAPPILSSAAMTPTGQVSGEASPGAVEWAGPPPPPQQPVDPASVMQGLTMLYLPLVAQEEGVQASAVQAVRPLNMRVLVIAADGNETDYPAIIAFLNQLGIPYDVLLSAQSPLTASMLSNGVDRGYYQGIILVTGNLSYFNSATQQWESGLDWAEWNTLWQYEAAFNVRQMTSYTYPGGWPDNYGLNLVTYQDTTNQPLDAQLTTAGRQVFSYLNITAPITFRNTWVYLATINDTAVTTPLLTTSEGYAIASIHTYPDGRQNLAITAANNAYLTHSLLLSYGTLNWLTRGVFLGYRKVWLNPQIDDLYIDSDMWDIQAQSDLTGLLFRLSGTDFQRAVVWQNRIRATYPLASSLTLEWAYNGEGASGIYSPDTLTPAVRQNTSAFTYVNHTYTHLNLDAPTTYQQARTALQRNHQTATTQQLTSRYFRDTMVQPDISGLYNAEFQRAAKDFGIKYLISDTSRPAWNNPSPNAGFYSSFQPSILIIPRRPTNLFYNLSTPEEWVSEYNCFYGPTGICAGGQFRYWDRNLTYAEILDKESDMWLQYLLKWDIDPLMFHQANLRAYNGANSLLGDLIEATLAKYTRMYNLPITFITQHNIGIKMAERMAYNASGVTATLMPCQSITLRTARPARIPVTGVVYGTAANREVYGGQNISYVTLTANQTLTLTAPACN